MYQAGVGTATTVCGRQAELAQLERLVHSLGSGASGSVLFIGEAGSGKTTLLSVAATNAAAMGAVVLTTQGLDAESRLAYTGLHRLLHPVARQIEALLDPRPGAALRDALDIAGDRSVDTGVVAAATYHLLHRLTDEKPVLLVVDDLQWLDRESRHVLTFLVGRTARSPLGLVAATRDETVVLALPTMPTYRLGRLDDQATGALLAAHGAGSPPPSRVCAAVNAGTAGNPRALAELATLLTPQQLSGAARLPDPLPLGVGTEWAFGGSIRHLPPPTQRVLLVAAAEPGLDAAALGRAAEVVDARLADLTPAEAAGLVTVDATGVAFRHPLVRAAAYHVATSEQRRAAHEAIIRTCPGRALSHRALIAMEPCEGLATELEEAATWARIERGHDAAFERMQWAAELTPSGPVRRRRFIAAATDAWLGGNTVRALANLDRALVSERTQPHAHTASVAEVELARAEIALRRHTVMDAYESLLAVAAGVGPDRPHIAARALITAGRAGWYAGDLRRFAKATRRAEALSASVETEFPPAIRLGLDYLTGLTAEFAWRTDDADRALRRVAETSLVVDDPAMLVLAAGCTIARGEEALVHALVTRAIHLARARHAAAIIPHAIEILTQSECWSGRFPLTTPHAWEGLQLARDTDQPNSECHMLAMLAMAAAINGNTDDCQNYARAAHMTAQPHGVGLVAALAAWALAMLDVVYGRWTRAYRRLGWLYRAGPGIGHPIIALQATQYFVEAAAAIGAADQARGELAEFERWADATNGSGQRAVVARCHALLADGPAAADHFAEAVEFHLVSDRDFERGYTELLFARYLRRNRRRTEARQHLYSALEVFERLELDLWTKRVRAELRATGERTIPQDRPTDRDGTWQPDGLTAQQLQIARRVAEGATNREIAEQLFVSARTVDYHLRNIFQRLGVKSRAELIRHFR